MSPLTSIRTWHLYSSLIVFDTANAFINLLWNNSIVLNFTISIILTLSTWLTFLPTYYWIHQPALIWRFHKNYFLQKHGEYISHHCGPTKPPSIVFLTKVFIFVCLVLAYLLVLPVLTNEIKTRITNVRWTPWRGLPCCNQDTKDTVDSTGDKCWDIRSTIDFSIGEIRVFSSPKSLEKKCAQFCATLHAEKRNE